MCQPPLEAHTLLVRRIVDVGENTFNQVGFEHGCTVLKGCRKDSSNNINLIRVKIREGIENIIRKNLTDWFVLTSPVLYMK